MNVLVTGGAGFIGGNFLRYILRWHPDWSVVCYDALTYAGNVDSLADLWEMPNFEFVRGDICDGAAVQQVLERGVDAVVNFAAESHVDRSILDASPFIRTNILGTEILIEAVRRLGVPRYVQISTDEVYGQLGAEGRFVETTAINPNSPYSASKAAADLLCLAHCRTNKTPVVITRASNNYGPYQFPEKLIPLVITNALEGKPIPIYGSGKQVRDWLFVEDFCSAIETVLLNGRLGEVYNVGANCEKQNIQLVTDILDILDKPHSLITYVADRPGHDFRYAMDSSKLQRELGWRPAHKYETALARTVHWYLDNKPWWRKIKEGGDYHTFYVRQYGRPRA